MKTTLALLAGASLTILAALTHKKITKIAQTWYKKGRDHLELNRLAKKYGDLY